MVLLSVFVEPALLSAVGLPFAVPAGEFSVEVFAPPVEVVSEDDFDLLSLFISPDVCVEDFLSTSAPALSWACCGMGLLPPLSSAVGPDFLSVAGPALSWACCGRALPPLSSAEEPGLGVVLSFACDPDGSRDIEELAAPPLSPLGAVAAGASPLAPPWFIPCAKAKPVVNKAAVATETSKRFLVYVFLLSNAEILYPQ